MHRADWRAVAVVDYLHPSWDGRRAVKSPVSGRQDSTTPALWQDKGSARGKTLQTKNKKNN
jgi:hypothetical protein